MRQSQSDSKEHYLSNAKPCDGKDPKEFGTWLDDVSRLATISGKDQAEVAMAISRGPLHKYINELYSSGLIWASIKPKLQERFSECGSSTIAKHKLTHLMQTDLAMHEYIAKFSDMAEHAYNIRPTDDSSQLLASQFIEGIQNPHVKSKLRSFQIKNLKEIFGFAIQEDQKQKIRAIDFGESSNTPTIAECDIQAIKSNTCFKCGSDQHYIKDCPLNKSDNGSYQRKPYGSHPKPSSDSTPDSTTEPLAKLFNTMIDQLKQLTTGNHSNNSQHTPYSNHRHSHKHSSNQTNHRYHNNGNTHRKPYHNREHSHRQSYHNHRDQRYQKGQYSKSYKPQTKIHEMDTCSDCTSECSDMSDFEEQIKDQEPPTQDSPKN